MKKNLFLLLLSFLMALKGYCFDLKTHLWVAQQLLNDVIRNKAITLNGKQYQLNEEVYNALINYPYEFRIGTLGIDVFPDPIVGQITAHPGLENGWKTDDWIQHVLNSATDPDEIAFAYGYACHAAMDIFAHTWVNAYAGDIFLLTDSEIAVERRHFALEKYIGNHMPEIVLEDGRVVTEIATLIGAPYNFLSRTFILNNNLTGEYIKSGSLHLVAMNSVYETVKGLDHANQEIVSTLAEKYIELLKQQAELVMEVDKQASLTAQAGLQLKIAKEALDLKIAENNLMREKIQAEKELITKAIQTKRNLEDIIQQKHRLVDEANKKVRTMEYQISDIRSAISRYATELAFTPLTIPIEVSKTVTRFMPGFWYPCGTFTEPLKMCNTNKLIEEVIKEIQHIANPAIDELKRKSAELADLVSYGERQLADLRYNAVSAGNDLSAKTEELKNLLTNKALSEANEANYKIQLTKQDEEIWLLQESYNIARDLYEKAKEQEDGLRKQLEAFVDGTLNVAKDMVEQYNLLHLLIQNWQGDIEQACESYIIAGENFAKDILSGTGNGFAQYQEWHQCWSPVFTAVPAEVPQGMCQAKEYYDQLNEQLDQLLERLGPLQYLVAPTRKLKQLVMEEAKKKLEEAAIQISNHIFGEQATDFFEMISGREEVTTAKLIDVFKEDGSGKNLINFTDVTKVVNKEMGLADDDRTIEIEKFATLHNALQLSKLAVLPGISLNTIYTNYIGTGTTTYGPTLYPPTDDTKFTILNKAVSSIDGSSQWMHTSVPIYRRTGFDDKWPAQRQYGYSHCENAEYGFRFWVDPEARKKIFPVLFNGPLTPALYAHAAFNQLNRKFIPCKKNPFPNTEKEDCSTLGSNTQCN